MTPPDPFTPMDCDLRGMEWMPLFGARLFMSDFEARATDEEFHAAVRLWWMAWQQIPAASLPNDDHVLCRLAGLGRDVKAWLKMREAVLHGFTLCSDGRFYHKLLAGQAKDAWDRRVRERERKAAYRAKKDAENHGTDHGQNEDVPRDMAGTTNGTGQYHGPGHGRDGDGDVRVDRKRQDRTGQDRTGKEKERERESVIALPRDAPARRTKIPQDWLPDANGREYAREVGINDLVETIATFVNYYTAHSIPMPDWEAAWRLWCDREPSLRKGGR